MTNRKQRRAMEALQRGQKKRMSQEQQAQSPEKPIFTLTIEQYEGRTIIKGPTQDPILCYGLLEMGRRSMDNHYNMIAMQEQMAQMRAQTVPDAPKLPTEESSILLPPGVDMENDRGVDAAPETQFAGTADRPQAESDPVRTSDSA